MGGKVKRGSAGMKQDQKTNTNRNIFIKNIYYMLAFAYQTLQGGNFIEAGAEDFEHIYDLYARILERGMVNQVKRGLYKEYQEKKEGMKVIRGRIELVDSMKRWGRKERGAVCSFDDFTENCKFNQIIKAVGYFLMTRQEVKKENREALKKVLLRFSEVELISWRKIAWDKIRFYRNNASYEMLLYICRCTVERELLTEQKGEKKAKDYWEEQNLPKLFERFVLEYYKVYFSQYKPMARKITWDAEGNQEYLPDMRTDVKMNFRERCLIIDTKFYKTVMQKYYERETIHSANLYQIYAYVKNEDKENKKNVAGVLLYAKTAEGKELDEEYQMGGSKIGVVTIDLGKEFCEIEKRLKEIVERYLLVKVKE